VKEKKAKVSAPIGIRVNHDVHDLMIKVAPLLDSQVGDAYTEAAAEWLRRSAAGNPIVRSVIDQKCSSNNELRLLMNSKASLISKRA
jgi:hypothetical protein